MKAIQHWDTDSSALLEILLELSYDKSVDYWTFGILMYEMLTGYVSKGVLMPMRRCMFNIDCLVDPFPMW